MSKPAILAVDDDPAIAGDLRRRHSAGYRIVRTTSGDESLPVLARPAPRDRPVALDTMKRAASATGDGAMPVCLVHRCLAAI
jgi:hypothetical protein